MTAVAFTDDFWPSVSRLDTKYNARVIEALNLFNRDSEHPNLHLKPLRKNLDGLWSIRAGRDVRVLMERRGDTYVWLEAGLRRDIYERAERGRFVVNEKTGFMGFVTAQEPPVTRTEPLPAIGALSSAKGGVLDHWETRELEEAGLTAEEIETVRNISDEYDLFLAGLDEERLDLILEMLASPPTQFLTGDVAGEERLQTAIASFGSAAGVSKLFTTNEIERLLAAPIEDWMVFLHPDQRAVAEAEYRGPARVRGAAGTGKTVVGLHRAAELSRRYPEERILFVTYSEQLLPVLRNLFVRLPNADVQRVDFHTVHTLVAHLIADAPFATREETDRAFEAAMVEVVTPGSPLDGLSSSYLRAEVEAVIRGRGATSFDEYKEVQRRGRRVGFSDSMKRQAWDLHTAWHAALGDRVTIDDVLAVAADRALGSTTWRCAIVDEAQDLTMAQLDVVRNLVANPGGTDRSDGLMLCGDGAQKVRPGGYTLRQAGIEVRGRTTILRRNYRTTAEIMQTALAIAGAEDVVDLDEEFRRGELEPDSERSGDAPRIICCTDEAHQARSIANAIEAIAAAGTINPGDIAVLTAADELDDVARRLSELGVATIDLRSYDGTTSVEPKVGSWAVSKGLEFKGVIVTGCGAAAFPSPGPAEEWSDEREERRLLELSHMFVAMTRARDHLTLVAIGELAPEVAAALGSMSAVEEG